MGLAGTTFLALGVAASFLEVLPLVEAAFLVVVVGSFLVLVVVVAEAAVALTDMARMGWAVERVSAERKAERLNIVVVISVSSCSVVGKLYVNKGKK